MDLSVSENREQRCSFCGRKKSEVKRLIASRNLRRLYRNLQCDTRRPEHRGKYGKYSAAYSERNQGAA